MNFVLVNCNHLYNVTVSWILTEPECWNDYYLKLGSGVSFLIVYFMIQKENLEIFSIAYQRPPVARNESRLSD